MYSLGLERLGFETIFFETSWSRKRNSRLSFESLENGTS